MNDDLIAILEGMRGALDQIGPLSARLDRIEAQQQEMMKALDIIAEMTLLTYTAAGGQEELPDEIIDAAVMERAIERSLDTRLVRQDASEAAAWFADIFRKGLKAMDAELAGLRERMEIEPSMAERIRIALRARSLDQVIQRSFSEHQREQAPQSMTWNGPER